MTHITDRLLDDANQLLNRFPEFAARSKKHHRQALRSTLWARMAWDRSLRTAALTSVGWEWVKALRVCRENKKLFMQARLALHDSLDELALPPAERTAIEQELSTHT
jgi:hypothetical protein